MPVNTGPARLAADGAQLRQLVFERLFRHTY